MTDNKNYPENYAEQPQEAKTNCPVCGEEIAADSRFCPHCGSDLSDESVFNDVYNGPEPISVLYAGPDYFSGVYAAPTPIDTLYAAPRPKKSLLSKIKGKMK